ncbi:MAG: DEAD/DEAH box helicase, partial [Inquilinus sp.]|nr:DEAD/DEAH box helicase [Inquilinus sp.]
MTNQTFQTLGLAEPVTRALADTGYTTPTPIQIGAIPHQLNGRDLLGLAQTGTGKTAAFGLPILNRLLAEKGRPAPRTARALVLAPTRELAVQIEQSLKTYGRHMYLSTALVLGGLSRSQQIRALARGVDILVATPGRLIDLMGEGAVKLGATRFLVLDEADRMLDMGFIRDVRRILAALPRERQSVLFSATMP